MSLRMTLMALAIAGGLAPAATSVQAQDVTATEARAIAKEAYVYGFPMVDHYRIQYAYFQDSKNPEYKIPWNTLVNTPRVYTPADTSFVTPKHAAAVDGDLEGLKQCKGAHVCECPA